MAINLALKRAQKAQRRKRVAEEKRRAATIEKSLGARVLRAARAPIQHCLLMDSLFEIGVGTLVLARGATPHYVGMGCFLIDVFCLGIKDVMFKELDEEMLEPFWQTMDVASPMISVDPSYARKLLRDLAAWSHRIGFAPHREFAAVEPLFGDVNADACDAVFQFGCDGKPRYIPGPGESRLQIRHRLEHLRKTIGEGGFETDFAA
jgi:hypothetical protein